MRPLGLCDQLHEPRLQACGFILMYRAVCSGLVRGLSQERQERLGLCLLPCAQVLANLPYYLANALLALQIAQSRTLALP